MKGSGYRLLGFAVWRAGKWYLRRRLPSRRVVLAGALAGCGLLAAGLAAKRLAG
jgi:hypothetical protein